MALHRGADGFMSLNQFETFYWPGLKKIILALIDAGLTPFVFFEGDFTSRLEYLTELPKGKTQAAHQWKWKAAGAKDQAGPGHQVQMTVEVRVTIRSRFASPLCLLSAPGCLSPQLC